MPSSYAHYRFGAQGLPALPPDIRRTAARFRELFDVGLHGPDLFFYYSPLSHTAVGSLGHSFHMRSGKEFFQRCARRLRMEPTEAGLAYLYGVLGHYCLDSLCHPQVTAWDHAGAAGHTEIEVEFDRFLLEQDGKIPPHTQDLSPHMRLGPGSCETIAGFYPPATPGQIRRALGNMARATALLATPNPGLRKLIRRALHAAGGKTSEILMPAQANSRCAWAPQRLLPLYRQALERYPVMAQALSRHLSQGAPLPPEFAPNFG